MEAIQQARKLFLKCHHHQASLTDIDKHHLSRDIQRFITIAIKEATSRELFQNTCVLDNLKSALKQRAYENSDVLPVARAFQSLEKYFLLLVDQPWKPEFKEIKMYGGFYRTRIRSVLPNCESVFEHAGYMILPESCSLIYKGPINKSLLLLLAFDCRVGQVECETIAEHYNKVKGLSMTLSDAISNILHDDYTQDQPSWNKTNGMIMNMSPVSYVTLPPALPKRDPIVNKEGFIDSSNKNPNVRYQSEYPVYDNSTHKMSDRKFESEIAFPQKSVSRTSDFHSSTLSRPALNNSSAVIPESLTYIDALTDEILPELPEGTSEDHIWESLKLVKLQEPPRQQQQAADNWKQFRGYNDNKSIPSLNQSNSAPPTPYYVNGLNTGHVIAQTHYKPSPSIDEGVVPDLSTTSKSFSQSSKFGSIGGGQPLMSNKHGSSLQHPSVDYGYRTINFESIHNNSPNSVGMGNNLHQMIYHPPNIVTDAVGQGMQNKTPVSNVPPPIPCRTLKPKSVQDEECLRAKIHTSVPQFASSQQGSATHLQNDAILSRPLASSASPGYSTLPQVYNTEPILRREKLSLGKTNSLKVGESISPLSQQVAAMRAARSMDMALSPWKCQICTTQNIASSTICVSCSHSRLGPDISQPTIGETKKSCSSCTFANSPENTHCEICGARLHDKFTFV